MARTTAILTSRAVSLQEYLELLKTSEYVRFNKVLRKLERNVTAMLDAADGDLSAVPRARLEKLLRDMSKINKRDLDESVADHLERLESFAGYSYALEAGGLARLSSRIADAMQADTPQARVWRAARERPLSATGDLLEPFVKDLGTRQVAILERTVRKAATNGMSTGDVTRLLKGTKKRGYADGMMTKLGKQTATVVRTAMQHVNNSARQVVWADNDDIVTGYRWVSTLDDRTSDVCQDLDGEVFKIGDGPIPPAHPNCRSTTIAELRDEFDIFDKGATRSSADGYIPADTSFHEWLEENG